MKLALLRPVISSLTHTHNDNHTDNNHSDIRAARGADSRVPLRKGKETMKLLIALLLLAGIADTTGINRIIKYPRK